MAVAFIDNVINVYDLCSFEWLFELKGHATPVCALVSYQNGKRLATVGKDGVVRFWEADKGTLMCVHSTLKTELTDALIVNLAIKE